MTWDPLQREILAEEYVPLPLGHAADTGVQEAVRLLDHLVAASELRRADIAGCGVAIPGPIDARTGRIIGRSR